MRIGHRVEFGNIGVTLAIPELRLCKLDNRQVAFLASQPLQRETKEPERLDCFNQCFLNEENRLDALGELRRVAVDQIEEPRQAARFDGKCKARRLPI